MGAPRRGAGRPAWAAEARWGTFAGRKAEEVELARRIEAWTAGRDPETLAHTLQAAGVHASPVRMMADLFTDPQLAFRGIWRALDHPGMGRHHYKAPPFVLSRTPGRPRRPAPCLGEHTRAVLVDLLGLTEAEVATVEAQASLA